MSEACPNKAFGKVYQLITRKLECLQSIIEHACIASGDEQEYEVSMGKDLKLQLTKLKMHDLALVA